MSASAIFDEQFYLTNNADVVVAISQGIFGSALQHFNLFGGKELRAPNATFDPNYYAVNNADVLNAVSSGVFPNVFAHYQAFGEAENRAPTSAFATFDAAGYLAANTDVAAAVTAGTFSSALDHFIAFGQNESRAGSGVTAVINPGTTSQFTTNADNFTGTANADTFNGVNGSTDTFTVIDILNGGAGTDTLNVVLDDNASVFPAATISNIENIVVRELANGTSIDTTAFGGETALVSDRSTGAITFTGVADGTALTIRGDESTTNGAFTATHANNVATINLGIENGTTAGAINIGDGNDSITTVNITSSGADNTVGAIDLNSDGNTASVTALNVNATTDLTTGNITNFTGTTSTITVTGAGDVDLGTIENTTVRTVSGANSTGGITATLNSNTALVVTGGSGNDSFTTGAVLGATGSVDAGDGTDTLTVGTSAHITATVGARYTNFETLSVGNNVSLDMDHVAGITSVIFTDSNAGNNTTVTDMSAAQAANVTARDIEGAFTLGIKTATGIGQLDTLTVTVDDGDTTNSENITTTTGVITATGIETINFVAVDDVEISDLRNAASLASMTLSGAGDHTITTNALAINANTAIDGSAATGVITFDAALGTGNGIRITTGSDDDVVTGTAQADLFFGNAGDDTFNTTGGADTVTLGAGDNTVTYADAATGGASVNLLTITDFKIGDQTATADIDNLNLTFDDIEDQLDGIGGITTSDLVSGTAANISAAASTIQVAVGSFTMLNRSLYVLSGSNLDDTDAVETALEAGGTFQATTGGTLANDDGFMVLYTDGTDSFIAAATNVSGGNIASTTFAATNLQVNNVVKLSGITDLNSFNVDNLDYA